MDETPDDLDDLPEQMRVRRAKYDRLMSDPERAPFPVNVRRTHTLAAVRAAYPELEAGTETDDRVGVTGRVIFFRNTGKLCFATIREDGVELQLMLSRNEVGEEPLAAWKADVDLGDHVFAEGRGDRVQARRAVRAGDALADDREGAASVAGRAPRAVGGEPGPPALRRPHRPARGARDGAHPCRRDPLAAPHPGRTRVSSRSRRRSSRRCTAERPPVRSGRT